MTLGDVIRQQRRARKWSQHELAAKLGVSPTTISNWEIGHSYPTYDLLDTLANGFGTRPWCLLLMTERDLGYLSFPIEEMLRSIVDCKELRVQYGSTEVRLSKTNEQRAPYNFTVSELDDYARVIINK